MSYSTQGRRYICVSGGKGGVGKSSFAAGLARALHASGSRVGLVDADLAGPSQSCLFELARMRASRGRLVPPSADGVRVASMGLLANEATALVWSKDAIEGALASFILDADWGDANVFVVDLPPGHDVVHRTVLDMAPGARSLFVTTGSRLAIVDCRRDIAFSRRMGVKPIGIVENFSHISCPDCGTQHPMHAGSAVDELAKETAMPIVCRLPFDADVASGLRMSTLSQTCQMAWSKTGGDDV